MAEGGKILRNFFEKIICALARRAFQKSERLPPASLLAIRNYEGPFDWNPDRV